MPSSARIVETASGWVMYGSPLLRFCPRCHFSATAYARSMSRSSAGSAFGSFALMLRKSGSSTGLSTVLRCPPSLASRARMPLAEVGRCAGATAREEAGAGRAGVAAAGAGSLPGAAGAAVGTTSSGKDTPRGAGPTPRTSDRG